MNNKTFTVEIQNISNVRSVPCGMEFTSGPPGYPEAGAANFDGVKFIDQKVNFAPRTVDYSLSGLFRMSNLDGTLLHYSDDAGIFQIMLWVKNGTLYMERHSTTVMIHTYFPGVVDSHIWYFVSVGVDYGGGKLIIQLIQTGTGTAVELTREIEKDIEFTMPGTLRIGGMQDSSQPNLEGSATCVAFYFGERQPTESVAKEQCIAYTAGACKFSFFLIKILTLIQYVFRINQNVTIPRLNYISVQLCLTVNRKKISEESGNGTRNK